MQLRRAAVTSGSAIAQSAPRFSDKRTCERGAAPTLCARAQVEDSMEDGSPGDQHMRKIAVHVSAYITHVRTQLKQTIPKAIVHCLVRARPSARVHVNAAAP
jgi:hypothetical protein